MNLMAVFSSPFKGEVGRGMGFNEAYEPAPLPHPLPSPPLEGEGGGGWLRLATRLER